MTPRPARRRPKPAPAVLVAHIDGGARGNPGPAGYGVSIEDGDGHPVADLYGYLGVATNNTAEYAALLALLEYAVAAGAPSGHNGTAPDLIPVAVDTLIPSLDASPPETASPVDSIGQQADVPAVVLSKSPLAAAADAARTDEDAAPPVEGATRACAQATIAALDQWLDAIHVARADRRA